MKKKALWLFNNIAYLIAGAAGIIGLLITAVNVVARYVFSHSIAGAEEVVIICFCYLVFVGAAAAYKAKMHYGVDVLVNLLPEKGKKGLLFVTRIIIIAGLLCLTYLSYKYAVSSIKRTTAYLRISYFWIDLSLVIGFGLMAVYSVLDLLRIDYSPEKEVEE